MGRRLFPYKTIIQPNMICNINSVVSVELQIAMYYDVLKDISSF